MEVVCDEGKCFGCVLRSERKEKRKSKTVDEMKALGYRCVFTSSINSDSDGVTCEGGKCFKCSPPTTVSAKFLDEAEDYLENEYGCGLYHKYDFVRANCSKRVLCEGDICVKCKCKDQSDGSFVSEEILEKVEDLTRTGMKCSVRLHGAPSSSEDEEIICERGGSKVCFVCRTSGPPSSGTSSSPSSRITSSSTPSSNTRSNKPIQT